ncbi:SulP family inorganic anion transporter [Streptomyces sp. ISL-99]|uniref:SulP family inorganic anion transporter n=1 Tax=Streptomyces sp. ISL-99 TaxID=2819193 RepID=UPI0035AFAB4D
MCGRAGARTKGSRVLHKVRLLIFAAGRARGARVIPVAALAGVLVHRGWKLIPVQELVPLWREHRGRRWCWSWW